MRVSAPRIPSVHVSPEAQSCNALKPRRRFVRIRSMERTSCCVFLKFGPPLLWLHIPKIAKVSDTSNTPQNDVAKESVPVHIYLLECYLAQRLQLPSI